MKKQYVGLIVVVAILLCVLFSFILYNQWPLLTGSKIVLATRPVDPFDLFRGQYMTIGYEIANIWSVSNFAVGDKIYVVLNEDEGGIWRQTSSSHSRPEQGMFIRGKVLRVSGESVRVEYGIEQFFFERHADLPTRNITVEVSVASSGRARLSQMLHNGEPLEIVYEDFSLKS
ncbi:GDYXXLXY domain-containing protein [Candidatus Woesearchaeota archaeon]|nr:GDYXXLXY domain-containing protein [Candidatus Woesearchaeota archaeon]